MKWVEFAIFVSIVLLVSQAAADSGKEPWNLRRVAVINLPYKNVEVRHMQDGRSIELYLKASDVKNRDNVLRALATSSLNYRLHPSLMGSMVMEVYSSTEDIDFSLGRKARSTYVLIGEVRPGKQVIDILGSRETIDFIPKSILSLFSSGRFAEAKRKLRYSYELDKEAGKNRDFKQLRKSRMAIVDIIGNNRLSARCQDIQETMETAASKEGAILSAWCHYLRRDMDTSKAIISKIEVADTTASVKERSRALAMRMTMGEILFASRNENPILAAKLILENRDRILKSKPKDLFLEIMAADMIGSGFGGIFSKMAQYLMARADGREMDKLAPVSTEAYWSVGQRVHASDSASYFLTRRQPGWIEGRLRRIRGRVHLQEGNWTAAAIDLESAKKLLPYWGPEDQLALVNARLFDRESAPDISLKLDDLREKNTLSDYQEKWFSRVWGETELREQRLPNQKVIDQLPAHVLFQAFETAKAKGNDEAAETLLKAAAKKNSEWGKLAQITLKTEELRKHVEIAKRMMK